MEVLQVPVVKIHSPKNHAEAWIINKSDFDPALHTLWSEAPEIATAESQGISPTPESPSDESASRAPTVDDFIYDENDNLVYVNIIDPERGQARKQIEASSYDPDHHRLWSTHARFQ